MLETLKSMGSEAFESLSRLFATQVGYDIAAHCRLDTAVDRETFITHEGGLATFFVLHGIRGYADEEESAKALTGFYEVLKNAFQNGDHTIHLAFTQDSDFSAEYAKQAFSGAYATLRRIGLESLGDLIDSDVETFARYISSEWCLMMVMTHPQMMSKEDHSRSQKHRFDYIQANHVPVLLDCQNPFRIELDLCNPHHALITMMSKSFANRGILVERLDAYETLAMVRRELDEEITDPSWRPRLLIDALDPSKMPAVKTALKAGDASNFLPSPIPMQLAVRDHDVERDRRFPGGEVVRVGSKYLSPIIFEEGPERPELFEHLLSRLNGDVPFRISFQLRKGGLDLDQAKRIFLSVFGWMGQTNKAIKNGYDVLGKMATAGEAVVSMRVCAVTWANSLDELARRQSVLMKALQTWGNPQVTGNVGDTYAAVMESIPGFGRLGSAVSFPAPLGEIIKMLPILRPASPWPVGSSFNFVSGTKLFPMQIGSRIQDTWNEGFYAPPGSGKSVLMNCLILAGILSPGLTELPPVLVLDVGPSSSGVISLLKNALPEGRKHLASYIKLRMSEEFTVNAFDTLPGCREPLPEQRETLKQLLLFLMMGEPNAEGKTPDLPPDADKLAGIVVDEVYRALGDAGSPKVYQPGLEPAVDAALDRYNLRPSGSGEISWWRVADRLMGAGDEYHSALAQRHAVPTFDDVVPILRTDSVQDLFNKVGDEIRTESTQTLVSAMLLSISSALREYPVLRGPTRFDLGEARVVVFDLNEVRHSKRQTGLMYLLTMAMGVRRFYAKESELDVMTRSAPEIYHEAHRRMARIYGETLKTLALDELHNTGGIAPVRAAIKVIQREGRKWGIQTKLSSQLLNDFDQEMIALMSSVFIMKLGNYEEVKRAKALFHFSDDVAESLFKHLNGPPHLFAYFLTKSGRYSQFLSNFPGAVKLWALNTTQEDMALRDRLYGLMPEQEARALLAKRFPEGTAKDDFQRIKKAMGNKDAESAVDLLLKELVSYRR